MAAPLNLLNAKVTTPDTVHEDVAVQILPGRPTAMVRRKQELLEERPRVQSVVASGPKLWTVTFEDGTEWTVQNVPLPCGCGG